MGSVNQADTDLAEFVGQYLHFPLGFVQACYPWGKRGTALEHFEGPDEWQRECLAEIGFQVKANLFNGYTPVKPIRLLVSSGHGVGKTTLSSWIVDWIMSTRPRSKGTVTANTFSQVRDKTWAAIRSWTGMCVTGHWFHIGAQKMYRYGYKDEWFCAPRTCEEKISESYHGQHAITATSFYIFDESSAIPDKIAEAAEGGLTDGEPMIFQFGNCTRSQGFFYRTGHAKTRDKRWFVMTVDSRNSSLTNKDEIEAWRKEHGEDSDFFRVRVRGLPPRASDLQFIGTDLVGQAQRRKPHHFPDDALICSLDVARGGEAKSVFRFRRGHDARSIAPIKISGEESRDSMRLVSKADELLGQTYEKFYGEKKPLKITTMVVDGVGIGGPLADRLRQMGHENVMEVIAGSNSPDPKCANMRTYLWKKGRDWLKHGAIDSDEELEGDLVAPGYGHDARDRLVLEKKIKIKDRIGRSTDDGDSWAQTFAANPTIEPPTDPSEQGEEYGRPGLEHDWMA